MWQSPEPAPPFSREKSFLLPPKDRSSVQDGSQRRNGLILSLTILNVVLFSMTIVLASITNFERLNPPLSIPQSRPALNAALKALSSYSPILNAIDIDSQTIRFDGTFFNNTSIYRADPSPSVDEAWEFLDHAIWSVSAADIRRVHKDPAKSIKVDPQWGLGDDAYIASFGFVHQIHCLNALRKEMHYDSYWDTPPSETHIVHRNHCLHMLLQTIMCHADVDIITYEWAYTEDPNTGERSYTPWPDFNMVKTCRNFDQVYEYLQENIPSVANQLHEGIQKPPNAPARSFYDL